MASIEIRKLSDGQTSHRVVWREAGIKQSETFGDAYDAARFRLDVEQAGNRWPADWVRGIGWKSAVLTERERNESITDARTVAEYALSWVNSTSYCRASEETRKRYRHHIRDHLAPSALGVMPVGTVAREDVQRWVDYLGGKGLSFKSIKNLRGELSAVFRGALTDGAAMSNPVVAIALPGSADDAREPVFLTHAQFDRLLACVRLDHRLLIETLAGTGMRWGEARELLVGDIDGRLVAISKARKHSPDGQHRIGRPKTRAGRRTVAVSADLAGKLSEHCVGRAPAEKLFPTVGADGTFDRNVWVPARMAAGLHPSPTKHDLRHSHASWFLADGGSLFSLSKRLGHASIQITADRYGHLAPDDEASMAVLDRMARRRTRQLPGI